MKIQTQNHSVCALLSIVSLFGCMKAEVGEEHTVPSQLDTFTEQVALEDTNTPQTSPEEVKIEALEGSISSENEQKTPSSTRWRIQNEDAIGDHWNIGEFQVFSDAACSVPAGKVEEVLFSYWYDFSPQSVVNDGECNTQGHANPNTWAGGDQGEHVDSRGSWLGYRFAEPITVACVKVCQGDHRSQWVENVHLQYFDGSNWVDFDLLQLEGGESTVIVSIDEP